MLAVLVGVDMLFCLFYILDYNSYIARWFPLLSLTHSDFYYWISVIMIVDFFLRLLLIRQRYLCVGDVTTLFVCHV